MTSHDNDSDVITLDALALELATGGKSPSKAAVNKLLASDSGEGGLTCEQAMSAHCSQKCTNGALKLLKQIK